MKNSKNLILGSVALLALNLAGCAGSGTSTTGTTVNLSGGLVSYAGTAAAAVDATTAPATVTLADGTTATLAAGSVAKGGVVGVIPAGKPVLSGLFLGSRAAGDVYVQQTKPVQGTPQLLPNKVTNLAAGAALLDGIALSQGTYLVTSAGPFTATSNGQTLSISYGLTFLIEVDANGKTSFPTTITASLPGNGGNLATSQSSVSITVDSAFSGRAFAIGISSTNGTLQQAATAGPTATFRKFTNDSKAVIPTAGITHIGFAIN